MIWMRAVKRVVWGIPLVWAVATISFFLVQLTPGSPAAAVLGTGATRASIAAFDARLGLDQPILTQYVDYLGQLVKFRFGDSWLTGQSVASLVLQRLPVTVELALISTLLALLIGVALGTLAAVRGGWGDRVVTGASGLGLALPNFWLAPVLVLALSLKLVVFPATGWTSPGTDPAQWAYHLALPVFTLTVAMLAAVVRQTRSAMRAQLSSDYIRTLRGAGLSEASIVWRHALRNAAPPVLTTAGLLFVGALGGAVVIEQVFALPGLGSEVVSAATSRDLPIVLGAVVFSAMVVLVVNIAIDLLVALLNPRQRTS